MKRKIIILLAACVAAAPLQAQNLEFGGLTYNNDLMMSTDFAALSRSHPFGTARVMGMGGPPPPPRYPPPDDPPRDPPKLLPLL